jgi:hypothetical protein
MTGLKVALLQTNAHGQHLVIRDLVCLLPLSLPVREMTLMKGVSGGNFAFSLNSSELTRKRAGNRLEDKATRQDGDKRVEQHGGVAFWRLFCYTKGMEETESERATFLQEFDNLILIELPDPSKFDYSAHR